MRGRSARRIPTATAIRSSRSPPAAGPDPQTSRSSARSPPKRWPTPSSAPARRRPAARGSAILAFWIGPAIRRVAAARDLRTVGDFLEYRYGPTVRALIAALLWVGSLFILAGQLFAMGVILDTVANIPSWAGCLIG